LCWLALRQKLAVLATDNDASAEMTFFEDLVNKKNAWKALRRVTD
jgi:hypothetical protein